MFAILKSYFPGRLASSELRLVALAISLINLVPALFGLMWFFTIIPLIGLWVFWEQSKIVRGKKLAIDINTVAIISIVYNTLLLLGIIAMGGNDIYFYPLITYLGSIIGLNLLLIRVQSESQVDKQV